MRSHAIGIAVLGICVLVVIIVGFGLVGSPTTQKLMALDETRLYDFSTISREIEIYYEANKTVPSQLNELGNFDLPQDPETKSQYGYNKQSATSYQLCTVFSTDSEETRNRSDRDLYYLSNDTLTHKKGYDCISYTIPDYLMNHTSQIMIDRIDPTQLQIATPSVELTGFGKGGNCTYTLDLKVSGLTPHSRLTVISQGKRTKCGQESENYSWQSDQWGSTDVNGATELRFLHEDYGTYNYVFQDQSGKEARFSTQYDNNSSNTQLLTPTP